MQIHHKPSKILILGKSGSGKTTWLLRYVQNTPYTRVMIFDHKMEFQNRLKIQPVYSFEDVEKKFCAGEKIISYHYSQEYPGDCENAFQDYSEWTYEACKAIESTGDGKSGTTLFVCDEVNRFTSPTDLGRGFKTLIEDGRLQGLDMVATSHAANQISNRLRLQLSEIVALETHDSRPLLFLEESGFNPDEVQKLNTGEYIVKNMDTDTFSRGRLFACSTVKKEVNQPQEQPTTENQDNAISTPTENCDTVHGHSSPE